MIFAYSHINFCLPSPKVSNRTNHILPYALNILQTVSRNTFDSKFPKLCVQARFIDMAPPSFEKDISNRMPLPCGAHAMHRQVRRHVIIIDQEFTTSSIRCIEVLRVMI